MNMTDPVNKKWILVILVWIGALILTSSNMMKLNQIKEKTEKKDFLQTDVRFLNSHAEDIRQIMQQYEALSHTVETPALGLLKVENELFMLAAKNKLTTVKVKSQPKQAGDGAAPITFLCEGHLKGMLSLLKTLRRDYLYLPVMKINIRIEDPSEPAKYQISLRYRYKTSKSGFEI